MSSTKEWDRDGGVGVPGSGFREIKQRLCCSSGGERNDFKKIRHNVVVVVKKTENWASRRHGGRRRGNMAVLSSPYVLVTPSSGSTFRFVFLSFFSAYLSFHLTPQCEKIKVIGNFFSRKICSPVWLCLHYYPCQRLQERGLRMMSVFAQASCLTCPTHRIAV